jgi:hypothetical protein
MQIDVADKDTVMCVNYDGLLWKRFNNTWIEVAAPAKLTQISISSNKHAVALDALGNTYFKSFLTPSWNWSLIPNIKLAYVAISNSMIVGLDKSGAVFYMNL